MLDVLDDQGRLEALRPGQTTQVRAGHEVLQPCSCRGFIVRDPTEEFMHLKAMHESAVFLKEGGKPVALLPAFSFAAAGRSATMDLLLVPFEHSGYTDAAVLRAQD